MRHSQNSLGFITTTIGRETLPKLITTFKEVAEPDDRLLILGDGWEEDWVHEHTNEQVLFRKCPKGNEYGYTNRGQAYREHWLTTDYIDMVDDDDEFYSKDEYEALRAATEGHFGVRYFPLCPHEDGIPVSSERYLRITYNNHREWDPWFGPTGYGDGWFYTAEAKQHALDLMKNDGQLEGVRFIERLSVPVLKCKVFRWPSEVNHG